LLSDRARSAARDAGILLSLACVLELTLHVVAPEYGHKVFDYELTGSYPIARNADGSRGTRVSPQKTPGVRRLLALGDSVTFGTGVPAERTWPAQLAELPRERGAARDEVVNAGIEGSSLADLVLAWDGQWQRYSPDVVILGVTANMVSLEAIERAPELPAAKLAHPKRKAPGAELKMQANRWFHELYTPSFASTQVQRGLFWLGRLNHQIDVRYPAGPMLAYGMLQGDLPRERATQAWQHFERNLAALAEHVRAAGSELVVLWLPPRFELSDRPSDNEKDVPRHRFTLHPAERIAASAQALRVPFVNGETALLAARHAAGSESEPALYIHFDYNHLDERGHAAVARAVLASMR
jgi:lysophospholipase L1-like esterase